MNTPAGLTPEREEWLAIRKREALNIDPKTAEVTWCINDELDPYSCLPEECELVGRVYYARSPDSDIWVAFSDLPDETFEILQDRWWSGELREKPRLHPGILAAIRDESFYQKLNGLKEALHEVLVNAPLSRKERASRLRWIAASLISRMAGIEETTGGMNPDESGEVVRILSASGMDTFEAVTPFGIK